MGGSGGKGFISDAGGWAVNPLEKAFGDVGGWISNPVYKILDSAGYGWAEPLGASTSGYVEATREGRGKFEDLYNPLMFGQTAQERMAAIDENQRQWQAYYEDQQLQFKRKMDELRGKMPETAQPKKPIAAPVMPTLLGGDLTAEDITGSLIDEQNKR